MHMASLMMVTATELQANAWLPATLHSHDDLNDHLYRLTEYMLSRRYRILLLEFTLSTIIVWTAVKFSERQYIQNASERLARAHYQSQQYCKKRYSVAQ
jgi:hypothetical protein